MAETDRSDYLMAGIYNLGALHQWTRQQIEGALVRNLGWAEPKARLLVGHWVTTPPYRSPAVTPDHLEDSPMNTTNPNKVT
jgi:hypothetical protein